MLLVKKHFKLNKLILFICVVIVLLMIFSYYSLNKSNINILKTILILISYLGIILISIKLNRYSNKLFFIVLIASSALIYFAWNNYAMTIPVSDYEVLLGGAKEILNGSFAKESFNKLSYFYFYNYQIGYTTYLAFLMKVFGNRIICFKISECITLTLTSIMIYKISEIIFDKDIAAISSVLYMIYIPNIMGSSIINNQHISTVFLCLSLYFMLKATTKSLLLSGIFLGFTEILRPVAFIVIIAFTIITIHKIIVEKDYFKLSKKYIIFIVSFLFIVKCFDIAAMECRIAPSPISVSNAKYFKFVLGLKGSGIYNIATKNARETQVYFDLKTLNFDYNKYNEKCMVTLDNLVRNYKSTSEFIIDKMYHFMGDADNQYYFALTTSQINNYIFELVNIGNIQYAFLLIGTFIWLIVNLKKSSNDLDILPILIIGFVTVHVFIETQPRYRYEIYVFTDILTSKFLGNVVFKLRNINIPAMKQKWIYLLQKKRD